MKEYTLSVTSKGQFTMPVEVRRALGVNHKANKLIMTFDPVKKSAKIQKPATFDDISKLAKSFIDKKIKPLEDPRAYYQKRQSKS